MNRIGKKSFAAVVVAAAAVGVLALQAPASAEGTWTKVTNGPAGCTGVETLTTTAQNRTDISHGKISCPGAFKVKVDIELKICSGFPFMTCSGWNHVASSGVQVGTVTSTSASSSVAAHRLFRVTYSVRLTSGQAWQRWQSSITGDGPA